MSSYVVMTLGHNELISPANLSLFNQVDAWTCVYLNCGPVSEISIKIMIFIQENAFENIIFKMMAILFGGISY